MSEDQRHHCLIDFGNVSTLAIGDTARSECTVCGVVVEGLREGKGISAVRIVSYTDWQPIDVDKIVFDDEGTKHVTSEGRTFNNKPRWWKWWQ